MVSYLFSGEWQTDDFVSLVVMVMRAFAHEVCLGSGQGTFRSDDLPHPAITLSGVGEGCLV